MIKPEKEAFKTIRCKLKSSLKPKLISSAHSWNYLEQKYFSDTKSFGVKQNPKYNFSSKQSILKDPIYNNFARNPYLYLLALGTVIGFTLYDDAV